MFSMCYPEAENSPLRDGEDLLRDSPSWALLKCQVDGEHLGPLVLGKSPLGLQYSKLTSQPSTAWMAVGGHLQHKALQGCPTGSITPCGPLSTGKVRATSWLLWSAPWPRLSQAITMQRLAGSWMLSFQRSMSDKTVRHLLIIWTGTIRLYLRESQHLMTATSLQERSSLYLLLPFL